MNFARVRALVIVGVLLIAAVVLVMVALIHDTQSHASYTTRARQARSPS